MEAGKPAPAIKRRKHLSAEVEDAKLSKKEPKAKRSKRVAKTEQVFEVEPTEPEAVKAARPKRKSPGCAVQVVVEPPVPPKRVRSRPLTRDEVSIPEDAIEAPSHCTAHTVYSCAYKRAEMAGKTAEECRAAAQLLA